MTTNGYDYGQLASFGGPRQPVVSGLQNFGFIDPHQQNFPNQPPPVGGRLPGAQPRSFITLPQTNNYSMLDQAWQTYQQDYGKVTAANEQHFADVGAAAGQVGTAVNQNTEQLRGQIAPSIQNLRGLAGQVPGQQQLGEDQFNKSYGDFQGGLDKAAQGLAQSGRDLVGQADRSGNAISNAGNSMRDQVVNDVNQSNAQMKGTVDQWGNFVNGFKSWSAQEAASTADGIRQSARTGLEQIKAATWSGMSPGEQANLLFQHGRATDAQVQQAQTQIALHARDTINQLNQITAQLGTQRAQLTQSGASIKGEAGKFAAGLTQAGEALKVGARESARGQDVQAAGTIGGLKAQGVQAVQAQAAVRQQWAQVTQQFNALIEQFQHAAGMDVANMEIQGRNQMAQWADTNKQSIVSMFNGMTALLALASQPGTAGIPAARLG